MSYSQPNAIPYRSLAGTNAQPEGYTRKVYSLPKGCPIQLAAYGLAQDYSMILTSFPPAPKNTLCNDSSLGSLVDTDSAANNKKPILTSYSSPANEGGGLGKFSAEFHIVPASWDDFQTQNVTFPGIRNFFYVGGVRDPKPMNVTIRVRNDYFVLDALNILGSGCSAGGGPASASIVDSGGSVAVQCVATLGDIPEVRRTPFGFLVSGSMLTTSEITGLVASGGLGGWLETVPNTGTYQAWIAYAIAHGWNSTFWDGTYANVGTSTIAQWCYDNSRLVQYAGNIYCRQSFYTLAN